MVKSPFVCLKPVFFFFIKINKYRYKEERAEENEK